MLIRMKLCSIGILLHIGILHLHLLQIGCGGCRHGAAAGLHPQTHSHKSRHGAVGIGACRFHSSCHMALHIAFPYGRITEHCAFVAEEVIPRNAGQVEIEDINEQYLSEFLEALQSAINQMSADGIRISHVASKSRELGKYMADTLDDDWNRMRGMEVQAVGIASVSYDEKSTELINMRNEGAMLSDPSVREGYMQGHVANCHLSSPYSDKN